jgi:hypothetical protein
MKGGPVVARKKIDLYQRHKPESMTPKTPVLLAIKSARYLAIGGRAPPGSARFTAAIGAPAMPWPSRSR